MRLEGLGKSKNAMTPSENRTRDLPASNPVPQPIMLPRVPVTTQGRGKETRDLELLGFWTLYIVGNSKY
jgi:hypothetical protein